MAVKFDSAKVEGADSAHYFYRCLRELENNAGPFFDCNNQQVFFSHLLQADHFLGQKMLINAAGVCRFVFSAGDTFLLKSNAAVGESWTWSGPAGAWVDSIVEGNVFGIADSLKYISLGTGKRIVLSKNHGCVEFPFPQAMSGGLKFMDASLMLDGIHEMGLGNRIPLGWDWLRKEAGSHFVAYKHMQYFGLGGGSSHTTHEFWVDSTTENASSLQIFAKHQSTGSSYSFNGGTSYDTTFLHDTVINYQANSYPWIFNLPFESPDTPMVGPFVLECYKWPQDPSRLVRSGGSFELVGDSCVEGAYHFWGQWDYLSGFGEFENVTDDPYGWSDAGMETQCITSPSLQYGTCPVVLANQPMGGIVEPLSVFPVPTSGIVTVAGLDGRRSGLLEVLSLEGKRVLLMQFSSGTQLLDLDLAEFGEGLYFLRISQTGKNTVVQKISVVD